MKRTFILGLLGAWVLSLGACAVRVPDVGSGAEASLPFVMVLGVAQDAGYPQTACRRACCQAVRADASLRRHVASLAIVDPVSGERWIVDCTPDFGAQLAMLDGVAPPRADEARALVSQPCVTGILLTHAHIGHYTGLQDLGREVTGASGVAVYAMPRMKGFLETNGPWSQLVELENIELRGLVADEPVALNERIRVTPLLVPHRDEFSETVGFRIEGPRFSVLYIPDIDKWEKWDRRIEDEIARVDVAYVDGTFFDGAELGGRDMSEIPHPSVRETMSCLAGLSAEARGKVRFTHLNHTNPLLRAASAEARVVRDEGFAVAREGEIVGL